MSGRLMGMVMRAAIGNPTAKQILTAYAYHANDTTLLAWPSLETIQAMTELSERAVREWKGWLVERAYLIPAGKAGRSPRFQLNAALLKPAPGAGMQEAEDEKPAPGAGIPEEIPAPGAGIQNKPALSAGIQTEKPALSAGKNNIPAPGAVIPAPGAPKTVRNINPLNKEEEEEEAPASAPADPRSWIIDAARAERIWTDVTGMVTVPGGLDQQNIVLNAIINLAPRHGPELANYLKPFYQALTFARTKDNRPYSTTNPCWITEWAIAGVLPDYLIQQFRMLNPKDLPKELTAWMLNRMRANGVNGKPLVHGRSAAVAKMAEDLGLVDTKGAIP